MEGEEKKQYPIFEKVDSKNFPEEVKNAIKLIAFSYDNAIPFGSYTLKAQPYPGDIDVIEEVAECCSKKEAIKKIVKRFSQIVRKIKCQKNTFITEIKAGLDLLFYKIAYDTILLKFRPEKLKKYIIELYNKKLLSYEEFSEFVKILEKDSYTEEDYEELKNLIREKYIVRWTADEVLEGRKKLIGNRILTFEEAIQQHTITKIDVVRYINEEFKEITNLYMFYYYDSNGERHPLNYEDVDLVAELKVEVKKWSSKYYFKPFKLAKRMFSLSRFFRDIETGNKLVKLFVSDLGAVNKIISELETIKLILERGDYPPIDLIISQIDKMKKVIGSVTSNYNLDIKGVIDVLTLLTDGNLKIDEYVKTIDNLEEYLKEFIKKNTYNYLTKVNLFPPPKEYLPTREEILLVSTPVKP